MKVNLLLIFILLFFPQITFSQNQNLIDSLELELKKHNATKAELQIKSPSLYDSSAANILSQLSTAHWGNNPGKALDYAKQCLEISEQIGYKRGVGKALNNMAVVNAMKGDYLLSLELNNRVLKIWEDFGDLKGIAYSKSNIGAIYYYLGNYTESLRNYFASLKIFEGIGRKQGIASCYINIGNIYGEQENYSDALKNYFSALKIYEETGNKQGIATSYNNIGNMYLDQGNFHDALKNNLGSLKIREELGDKNGIAASYINIGEIYKEQGNYPEALKNFFASLPFIIETGDQNTMALSYNNIGNAYTRLKKFNDAASYLDKSFSMAKEISSLERIKNAYESMAILDSAQGNYKQALDHFKLFITYRDSIDNDENRKKIVQQQMQYDFDKKETATKAEQEKKDAIALKELQKQKLVRNGFMGGFAVVLLFAVVFFTQRNKIKKSKKRSDELLLNILPSEVAEELKAKGSADSKQFDNVTVMFTDFKNFTQISEKLSPTELVNEIHTCFKAFDHIIEKHSIEKIKTIGDSYMCAGGLPVVNKTHAKDVVNAALEIQEYMKGRAAVSSSSKQLGLTLPLATAAADWQLRIGIHTGTVVAGIVGIKKFAYDIWGDAVNIASRMESSGEAGKVNISGSTYQLVKDEFNSSDSSSRLLPGEKGSGKVVFIHRGKILAKNKGEIDMYFVENIL